MLRATLRGIAAHKLRLGLTAVAIILGSAFVAGTLVLTDTMRASFDAIFAQTTSGVDVGVRGTQAFTSAFGERGRVPVEVADLLAEVDGVAVVGPEVEGSAQLLDADGRPVGGQGPPALAFNTPVDEEVAGIELRDGRYPRQAGEIAVDAFTAERLDLALGDRVQVVAGGPVRSETVVGTIGFGELDNLGGSTITIFDNATALELFGAEGYTLVSLAAEEDVSAGVLLERVEAALAEAGYGLADPDPTAGATADPGAGADAASGGENASGDLEVLTGAELADASTAEVGQFLGFFTTALLIFAGVALLVGAFLIANTFSIIVAQRTRELALLRAVGASRRQVLVSVLSEAALVALAGSLLGLVLGTALASGLRALLDAFGIALPASDLVLAVRTVIVTLTVGVVVTLVAALAPALKSLRVPPVAALQAVAAPPPPRFGRGRYVAAGLVLVAGVASLAAGLFGDAGISAVAAGAAITLIGAALLAPLVTRPLVRALGAPVAGIAGVRGQLARENALRSPRRTAATASALMIGLALVSFVLIFGASISASAAAAIEESFLAEYVVSGPGQGDPSAAGLPQSAVDDLRQLDEVAVASPQRVAQLRYGTSTPFVVAGDPDTITEVLAIDVVSGSLDDFALGGVLVADDLAERDNLAAGDVIDVEFATTGTAELAVRAIIDGEGLDSDILLDSETLLANVPRAPITAISVRLAQGTEVAEARPALEGVLEPYPTARLLDRDEIREDIQSQVNQLLGLLSALLAMSVIIALFGIVNTLSLSVFERVRELGLLRAVGATRAQVRSMIRWEAVLIAVLGATFGLAIGVLFGWLVVTALAGQGITELGLPAGQLIASVILAALAGVVAAILPARRAARTEILRAIAAE